MRSTLLFALVAIACSSGGSGTGPARPGTGGQAGSGGTGASSGAAGGTATGGVGADVNCTSHNSPEYCTCFPDPDDKAPPPSECSPNTQGGTCCARPGYPTEINAECLCWPWGCSEDTLGCHCDALNKQTALKGCDPNTYSTCCLLPNSLSGGTLACTCPKSGVCPQGSTPSKNCNRDSFRCEDGWQTIATCAP